ncbi:hypothetical protein D3C71_927990 [compost metagenome]|jgi:hypothetical protein
MSCIIVAPLKVRLTPLDLCLCYDIGCDPLCLDLCGGIDAAQLWTGEWTFQR